MKEIPPEWLKRLEDTLSKQEAFPREQELSFPLEDLAESLIKIFELKSCTLFTRALEWKDADHLLQGLGQDPIVVPLSLTPLPGTLFWAIPKADQSRLVGHLLTTEAPHKSFAQKTLNEGYYTFAILKILQVINELNVFGDLGLQLSEPIPIPHEGAFILDLSIKIASETFWGRLILSADLQRSIKAHFELQEHSLLESPKSREFPLSLHFEVGSTLINKEEWESARVGDLILLDRCTYDPETAKASGLLVLGSTPLFQARLKEGEFKILEYAFFETPEEEEKEIFTEEPPPSLHLSLEIGHLTLPLEKILKLHPGSSFDLPHSLQLTLTDKGKPLAKGELVKIGENLGIKILSLSR